MSQPVWAPAPPDPETFRAPRGRSLSEARAEQDKAAGGRRRRQVALSGGGHALGSVELKCLPKSRRIYAYLRYQEAGRTINRYLGEACGRTRLERLRAGWRLARSKGLVRVGRPAK